MRCRRLYAYPPQRIVAIDAPPGMSEHAITAPNPTTDVA